MKKLIINADDLGMNDNITDGILLCWENRVISSTSIMPTEAGFNNAIKIIKQKNSKIPIGVHLSFSSGIPISSEDKISSLITNHKFIFNEIAPNEIMATLMSINPKHLEIEFENQITKCIESGINITHIDNHMYYIYMNPELFMIVIKLANKYNLPLRWPFAKNKDVINDFIKSNTISSEIANKISDIYSNLKRDLILKTTDYYYQIPFHEEFVNKKNKFLSILENLKEGTSELCIHPGLCEEHRKMDYDILNSNEAKEILKRNEIILINQTMLNNNK
ncbi:MAG: ChbG/HpnK family deacetylase [Silvanigrellaceae bacterium]|nr:ChbG/HpnK family deacetylase [Silvanigrellaceae bacterium]